MHHSEKDKSRAEKWFREGLSLRREGEFRRAIEAFDRAIEADRDFAEAYFEKGVCHYSLKNHKDICDNMDAATLLGCARAQMWSRFETPRKLDERE